MKLMDQVKMTTLATKATTKQTVMGGVILNNRRHCHQQGIKQVTGHGDDRIIEGDAIKGHPYVFLYQLCVCERIHSNTSPLLNLAWL